MKNPTPRKGGPVIVRMGGMTGRSLAIATDGQVERIGKVDGVLEARVLGWTRIGVRTTGRLPDGRKDVVFYELVPTPTWSKAAVAHGPFRVEGPAVAAWSTMSAAEAVTAWKAFRVSLLPPDED